MSSNPGELNNRWLTRPACTRPADSGRSDPNPLISLCVCTRSTCLPSRRQASRQSFCPNDATFSDHSEFLFILYISPIFRVCVCKLTNTPTPTLRPYARTLILFVLKHRETNTILKVKLRHRCCRFFSLERPSLNVSAQHQNKAHKAPLPSRMATAAIAGPALPQARPVQEYLQSQAVRLSSI